MPYRDVSIEECRELAAQILATREIDWTSEEFAAYLFGIMQPKFTRQVGSKPLDRVPDSDSEAISRVLDRSDRNLDPIDDKTLKHAR